MQDTASSRGLSLISQHCHVYISQSKQQKWVFFLFYAYISVHNITVHERQKIAQRHCFEFEYAKLSRHFRDVVVTNRFQVETVLHILFNIGMFSRV